MIVNKYFHCNMTINTPPERCGPVTNILLGLLRLRLALGFRSGSILLTYNIIRIGCYKIEILYINAARYSAVENCPKCRCYYFDMIPTVLREGARGGVRLVERFSFVANVIIAHKI